MGVCTEDDDAEMATSHEGQHISKPKAVKPDLDPAEYCTFGKNEGKRWSELDPNQLDWYWQHFQDSLNDESKKRYHPEYIRAMDGIESVKLTEEAI